MTTLPDAELVLVTALQAALPDTYVSWNRLPDNLFDEKLDAGTPQIVVNRLGGSSRWGGYGDRPSMDIDVYSNSKELTNATIQDVRRVVHGLRNTQVIVTDNSACVSGVTEDIGPNDRPDSNPDVYRVGLTFGLYLRPV